MSAEKLEVRAVVFDAYGTLFDFASAAATCRDALGDNAEPLTALWRDKQLQYSWLRGLQGRHCDFWQVTGDALDFAMETLGINDDGLRDRLMGLYRTLKCFGEVPDVLRTLPCMSRPLTPGGARLVRKIDLHFGTSASLEQRA